jgi:hypothetical protein
MRVDICRAIAKVEDTALDEILLRAVISKSGEFAHVLVVELVLEGAIQDLVVHPLAPNPGLRRLEDVRAQTGLHARDPSAGEDVAVRVEHGAQAVELAVLPHALVLVAGRIRRRSDARLCARHPLARVFGDRRFGVLALGRRWRSVDILSVAVAQPRKEFALVKVALGEGRLAGAVAIAQQRDLLGHHLGRLAGGDGRHLTGGASALIHVLGGALFLLRQGIG